MLLYGDYRSLSTGYSEHYSELHIRTIIRNGAFRRGLRQKRNPHRKAPSLYF